MPIGRTNTLAPLSITTPDPKSAASAAVPCAVALRHAILAGELPPGVRLPPERGLAERFGVNRVTIRAALAQLEAEHLLTVRQGSGYTVRDYVREGGPDLIGSLIDVARSSTDKRAILADLLLVRRQLARGLFERLLASSSASSAASSAAHEQALDRAEQAVVRFAKAAKKKAKATDLASADLEIVQELVSATGSIVLALCLNPIAALLRNMPGIAEAMYRDPQDNAEAWSAILAWLRAGNRNATRRDLHEVDVIIAQLAERDESTIQAFIRGAARKNR